MIRRSLPEGDLLIPQDRHALQAGRFAALHAHLPEPRAALVRAVSLHDAGWPCLDDRPEPLDDGRPPHVFDLPDGASRPAWRRSIAVARAVGRLEALWVSLHFSGFSAAFAREQTGLHEVWRSGIDPELERAGLETLRYCDALSLRVLCDPGEHVALPAGSRYSNGRLDPWPFLTDRVADAVVGRLLPRRRWKSAADLQAAYQEAPTYQFCPTLKPF
jgi:hypothetical protein